MVNTVLISSVQASISTYLLHPIYDDYVLQSGRNIGRCGTQLHQSTSKVPIKEFMYKDIQIFAMYVVALCKI